jgi:hypothetical protein
MSNVQEIESAMGRLSAEDMRQIYNWLENILEDQLEISEVFQERIERSEREMAQGKRPPSSPSKSPVSKAVRREVYR